MGLTQIQFHQVFALACTQKREQSYTIVRPHFTNSLVISTFQEKVSNLHALMVGTSDFITAIVFLLPIFS